MATPRASLLIRCSQEEAERIRSAAKQERRSISGYVLNAVLSRMQTRERLMSTFQANTPPRPRKENG